VPVVVKVGSELRSDGELTAALGPDVLAVDVACAVRMSLADS
jgi:hypothetical protein